MATLKKNLVTLTYKHILEKNIRTHICTHIHLNAPHHCLPFCVFGQQSFAALLPRVVCGSPTGTPPHGLLLVTSVPSARSAQLRSSGISAIENLLRIQKKHVHTSNCDGVFHPGLTASFFPAQSPDEKLFHLTIVINQRNPICNT